MYLQGRKVEDLASQLSSALSEIRLSYGSLVPIITTEGETEHRGIKWNLEGASLVQYTDNTNIPAIILEATEEEYKMFQIVVQLEQTAVDRLAYRQRKNLEITPEAIRSALGLAIEEKCSEVFLKGESGTSEGLTNLKEATILNKDISSSQKLKEALIELRHSLLTKGAKSSGVFTVLLPLHYESILKDIMVAGDSTTFEEFLYKTYRMVFAYSLNFDKIVMFQDTFGNLYFHRMEHIEVEERLSYENTSKRWFATLDLAGLVVKNKDQVGYLIDTKDKK